MTGTPSPRGNLLDELPTPDVIHRRLGEVLREERLLRRLLRFAMQARDERRPAAAVTEGHRDAPR
jgi:hypothetical protein